MNVGEKTAEKNHKISIITHKKSELYFPENKFGKNKFVNSRPRPERKLSLLGN